MANPIASWWKGLPLSFWHTGQELDCFKPRGPVQTDLQKLLVTTLVRYYYFFEGTIQRRYSCSYQVSTGGTLNPLTSWPSLRSFNAIFPSPPSFWPAFSLPPCSSGVTGVARSLKSQRRPGCKVSPFFPIHYTSPCPIINRMTQAHL